MRAQISFEAMVYFTLAGLALLFGVTVVASRLGEIRSALGAYGLSSFTSTVAERIEEGDGTFDVYVPSGACNSTITGNRMTTAFGQFYLPSLVVVNGSAFCPDGEYANLTVAYEGNGRWVISR